MMAIAIAAVVLFVLAILGYRYYESVQRDRESARMQSEIEQQKQLQQQKDAAAAQQVHRFSSAVWDALILVPGISKERQDQYEQASKWLDAVQPEASRKNITVRYFRKDGAKDSRINALLADTWGLFGYNVELSGSKMPGETNVIWAGSKVPPET